MSGTRDYAVVDELLAKVRELERERDTLRAALKEISEDTSDDTWASDRALQALADVSPEGEAPLRCTADCDRTFHESCDAHGIKAAPELWCLPVSPKGEA